MFSSSQHCAVHRGLQTRFLAAPVIAAVLFNRFVNLEGKVQMVGDVLV